MRQKLITSMLILTLLWPAYYTCAVENGCLRPVAVAEKKAINKDYIVAALKAARDEVLRQVPFSMFPLSFQRNSPEYQSLRNRLRLRTFQDFRYYMQGREWIVFETDIFPNLLFKIRPVDSLYQDHLLQAELMLASILLGEETAIVDGWPLKKCQSLLPMIVLMAFL